MCAAEGFQAGFEEFVSDLTGDIGVVDLQVHDFVFEAGQTGLCFTDQALVISFDLIDYDVAAIDGFAVVSGLESLYPSPPV